MTAMMEPKTMDLVGNNFQVEDNYNVEIPEGEYLLVSIGAKYDSSASKFDHPNILQTHRHILSFKSYWPNGHKRWFEYPGLSFLFAIHKSKIKMLPKKGFSYVPVEIGGEEYRLNVSGGGGETWTDYVRQGSSLGVVSSKKQLKKIADCAYVPSDISIVSKEMDENDALFYRRLCAYYDTKKVLKEGDFLYMEKGCDFDGYTDKLEIVKRPKRKQHIVCCIPGQKDKPAYCHCKVKYKLVDWVRTAEINGISLVF